MQSLYDNTKKSRLTNTTKMSGKIYAKDLGKIFPVEEKDISKGGSEIMDKLSDKIVIDLQNAMIEQYLDKKARLIKFLEDKIKKIEKDASEYKYGSIKRFKFYKNAGIDIYKEVLDFVEKGDKNE